MYDLRGCSLLTVILSTSGKVGHTAQCQCLSTYHRKNLNRQHLFSCPCRQSLQICIRMLLYTRAPQHCFEPIVSCPNFLFKIRMLPTAVVRCSSQACNIACVDSLAARSPVQQQGRNPLYSSSQITGHWQMAPFPRSAAESWSSARGTHGVR